MMAPDALQPLPADRFGEAEARHLLCRAGFGGAPGEVRELARMGLDAAVDHLVDYERIDDSALPQPRYERIMRQATTAERIMRRQARNEDDRAAMNQMQADQAQMRARDRQQMARLRGWWLQRMIDTPRPLEEKLTLLWHGHFATSHRSVRDSVPMMRQHLLFRRGGKGDFGRLAASMIRDPAMLKYLNNDRNRRSQPNENLARELMELFMLGEGNYTESDIREGARALTGYHTTQAGEFILARRQHDSGLKKIFGKVGRFSGDDFVRLCLEHPACRTYISYKLYCWFVRDVQDLPDGPDVEALRVIDAMARHLAADRFNITRMLKRLFRSRHFHDASVRGGQIKSPAQLVVGTARMLRTPERPLQPIINAMAGMGQQLFDPPSVQGWPGGRTWISTGTLFARQNVAVYLITGKPPRQRRWSRDRIDYDPSFLLEHAPARSASAIVEHLCRTLISVPLHPDRLERLTAFLEDRPRPTDRDALIDVLLLITALPEYQLA